MSHSQEDTICAIATAQGVYDNASATVEQINQAITDIDAARTTYEGTELNAPMDMFLVLNPPVAVTLMAWLTASKGLIPASR